jgi:hypothetical protein
MTRAQTSHPLDPLSAAEIAVAVSTVRMAGATPEVLIRTISMIPSSISMRFDSSWYPSILYYQQQQSKPCSIIPSSMCI